MWHGVGKWVASPHSTGVGLPGNSLTADKDVQDSKKVERFMPSVDKYCSGS